MDTLAHKRRSKNFFFQKMTEEAHPLINKVPVDNFGGGIKKLNKKEYALTPEREKAITTSKYTFRTMNDYDVSLFNIFLKDFGYDHRNDTRSNRRKAVPYYWSARTKQNYGSPTKAIGQPLVEEKKPLSDLDETSKPYQS